jgi:hypothetical protein
MRVANAISPTLPVAVRTSACSRALRNFLRAIRVARSVERARFHYGPGVLLQRLRAEGARATRRSARGRRRLRRFISFIDNFFSTGRSCYRRALVEIALDAGAAGEPLHMGLKADGAVRSGHAWLGDAGISQRYDADFVI